MDESKFLIIKRYSNTNEIKDITGSVAALVDKGGWFEVTYNSSDKIYNDKKQNIQIYQNPQPLDLKGVAIFHEQTPLTNFSKILKFDEYLKFFFNDATTKFYDINSLVFDQIFRLKKNDFFEYLTEISNEIKAQNSEDILNSQLLNLSFSKDSALYSLTSKKLVSKTLNPNKIIFPFGTNRSQRAAVINALENNMSLIQGPPGTGKTQTILNIIANLLCRKKTVGIVAGNNEAIINIQEKLEKHNLDCFTAMLGKDENIKAFFSQQHPLDKDCEKWKISESEIKTLETQIEQINQTISVYEQYKEDVAILRQTIHELKIEKAINDAETYIKLDEFPLNKVHFTLERLFQLKAELSGLTEGDLDKFFLKIKFLFKFGIFKINKYISDITAALDFLDTKYYEIKLKLLESELKEKSEFLEKNEYEKLKIVLQECSKIYLKAMIEKNYSFETPDCNEKNYRFHFSEFTNRFPIVFSTTFSIKKASGLNYLYDYLIVDESSQVDIISAIIASSCAKNIVLVGDLNQLPPVVNSELSKLSKKLIAGYKIPQYWEYSSNSILDVFSARFKNQIKSVMLTEHYRCDPEIISFCNKRFYKNQLIIQTKHQPSNGVKVIYCEGHHARGRTSERQVDIIEKEILPLLKDVKKEDIGIIAPFNDQIDMLSSRLADKCGKIASVHKFQGKERDIIILSTVVNKVRFYEDPDRIDFLNYPNLLNVAISRPKNRLYLVISEDLMKQSGTILSDFCRYIKYYCSGTKIEKTKLYSVLDLQYKDFSKYLLSLKSRLLNRSKYMCENVIDTLLQDICDQQKFGVLSHLANYPLRKMVRTEDVSLEEDKIFLNMPNTHCDFVVFNDLDKSIVMAIEVDGYQHLSGKQRRRDIKKDRILKNAGIPLLRIKTTEMDCKEKIENLLHQIVKAEMD